MMTNANSLMNLPQLCYRTVMGEPDPWCFSYGASAYDRSRWKVPWVDHLLEEHPVGLGPLDLTFLCHLNLISTPNHSGNQLITCSHGESPFASVALQMLSRLRLGVHVDVTVISRWFHEKNNPFVVFFGSDSMWFALISPFHSFFSIWFIHLT